MNSSRRFNIGTPHGVWCDDINWGPKCTIARLVRVLGQGISRNFDCCAKVSWGFWFLFFFFLGQKRFSDVDDLWLRGEGGPGSDGSDKQWKAGGCDVDEGGDSALARVRVKRSYYIDLIYIDHYHYSHWSHGFYCEVLTFNGNHVLR